MTAATPESRFTARQLARKEIARKNGIIKTFKTVQPGTIALLNRHRRTLSMDAFLYKLIRWGEKAGYLERARSTS
jgi:hypothetical protein